ncbi:MAG: methylenetetrahydrofolate reductase C-terminal domain-containing protein [Thermoguttaceae bacterium]|nr:methylenetetrahydrofolate reductase C-terminal domain-containing protein [Thermoguttaceae bacterium]MDW8079490.1 methylenetetrahydrofolate reductase C-terminal domain-containing protein [Thermoguttaceae bacterium]
MIVARRKPLAEIEAVVQDCTQVLVVGCGSCMAVCQAGGEKEVEILARQLRMRARLASRCQIVDEITLPRQCDPEFLRPLAALVDRYQALVSMACGAGVQLLAEQFAHRPVFPALDTLFLGVNEGPGTWGQRCLACGQCILHLTAGICPKTLCAKGLLNGPCGGTKHGKCEVNAEKTCAWAAIYNRLEKWGRLELIGRIWPPADWSVVDTPARHGTSLAEESAP